MKAFTSRPLDWKDAESIANRQTSLDTAYILNHLGEFAGLKEQPEILVRAEGLLRKSI